MKYFYKTYELYNVKKLKDDYNYHEIEANYKSPPVEGNPKIEKLGRFYKKDLKQII